jgi:hypothetical protein
MLINSAVAAANRSESASYSKKASIIFPNVYWLIFSRKRRSFVD